MTYYSNNPGMCRVDFFKESGKWYMTEDLDMSEYYNTSSPYDAVQAALKANGRFLDHFIIVVLEPYHQYGYPIMFTPKS